MTRRNLAKMGVLAPLAGAAQAQMGNQLAAAMKGEVLRRELVKEPVIVESIELLRDGKSYMVRARGKNGAVGYSEAHSVAMSAAYPILLLKVAPGFIGKDARDLETLIHEVYLANSNYKWQGLPFWVSVAAVEIALLDLMGKVAGVPVGALLGQVWRKTIPVYRASGNRGNAPEAEIQYLKKIVEETGAEAIKFRLGARMRVDDASTKRDLTMIPLTRKEFGSKMTIYADANGSYDVPMSIRMGELMEEQKFGFFEEPVPFDYYDETREIAAALKIPIALGEEEMSLRGFRRIIESKTARVIQPDIMYFGGMTRAMKVARMAAVAGLDCTVHMSGGGLGFLYVAHFASVVKNSGAHQEYKGEDDSFPIESKTSSLKSEKGILTVPTGPGLGIDIDPTFLSAAQIVRA
jgi:L-alanine-DL-glutamate epimerase-like enolase superfamily enzyme